jgi:phosphatidylinositol-3-phosphatase
MCQRLLIALGLFVGSCALFATSVAAAQSLPRFDHIFVIVMENHSSAEIIGNAIDAPYLNQLAANYGFASNYSGVAHPSLPNYLALIGGDSFGITSDCTTCFVNAPNLGADRIAASGRTWKAYMESMPSACFVGDAYPYAQRHNPFVYFNDIRGSTQCGNVVPLDALATDLGTSATTPAYAWITPNLCNDMHDCSIATGDNWLSQTVPLILGSPAYTDQNSLILITWDEDDATQANQVPMLVINPGVPSGYVSSAPYDHYSLLRTVEDAWGLAPLTSHDGAAIAMTDFFATPPSTARWNAGRLAYTGRDARNWGAEIDRTSGGQRVFNVAINGPSLLTYFDISPISRPIPRSIEALLRR